MRQRVAVVAVLAATLLTGCTHANGETGPSPSPHESSSAVALRGDGPKPPADGAWVGAAVQPTTFTPAGRIQAFQDFERVTGRRLDVVHTYHQWQAPFPDAVDRHFLDQGQQVLIGWAGSDCPGIAAGRYDALIRQRARDVKAFGKPVLIALRWEMDRPNLRTQVRSAADFVAAWKHTRKIFAEVGATDVGWVWAPTAKGIAEGYAQRFYPGDDQVDWLGVDAYTGPRLRPFATVLQPFMRFAGEHPGKPVVVAEFGLADRDGKRPAWLAAAQRYVRQQPRIKAVLYFNGNSQQRAQAQLALQPSRTGRAAFHAWLSDPYFNTAKLKVTQPE
ncbi:MAG TPA: hypothetical protein VF053_18060 [Streptosporangiales bacterium]